MSRILLSLLFAAAFVVSASAAPASQSTDWALYGNGDDQHFYSPLTAINEHNVGQLGLAWYADLPAKDGLVGNPIIVDGVIYQSGPLSRVYANDARTGKLLWESGPAIDVQKVVQRGYIGASSLRWNRGLAVWKHLVLVAAGDCRLVALDRKDGHQVWETVACDATQHGIRGAPRVGGDLVFLGDHCSDGVVGRGSVAAYDAATGKERWRFYVVPGDPSKGFENQAMAMAAKTWGSGEWWKHRTGCGSAWDAITYDPRTKLVYFGTDGASPFNPAVRSPDAGDELFTSSIVAVRADTGEYVWHYKTTPHDGWNFDATMHIVVADLKVGGKPRHVVMTAPKNGFFYVLDAATGAFISGTALTEVNWAKGIDPVTGRPIPLPDAKYWEAKGGEAVALPGPWGAHQWMPMSFSPETGLVYVPVQIAPALLSYNPKAIIGGEKADYYVGLSGKTKWKMGGEIVGWDPVAGKARWRKPNRLAINGGTMSTAGNLVFQGTAEGEVVARRASTGEKLWSMNVGGTSLGAASTAMIDGQQYVFVPSGNSASAILGAYATRASSTPLSRGPSRLLAFRIGGTAKMPPPKALEIHHPVAPRPAAAMVEKGHDLFDENNCSLCHGLLAESANGSVPDLRNADATTLAQLDAIVRGGMRSAKGMPQFPKLTAEDVEALRAYILDRAWAGFESQASGGDGKKKP